MQREGLALRLFAAPQVRWDASRAATDVVVKFIARGPGDVPLGADDVQVDMTLDGRPLDSEAILQKEAQAHAVNIMYVMVLDATRSLVVHHPGAFEELKKAAHDSVKAGTKLWSARPGKFSWTLSWFDDFVYRPTEAWPEAAILSLPEPAAGSFTRLYSAVNFAIDDLPRLARERHMEDAHQVLVVFTDGRDNHPSWAYPHGCEPSATGTFAFERCASPNTTLEALIDKVGNRADLTVHTLGLGDVDETALRRLARAGRGIYVNRARGASIDALFAKVTREFTTIQSSGATIPNAPGDYTFEVLVRAHRSGAQGRLTMRMHIGDAESGVLQTPALNDAG